ncbi:hypothetical protein EDB89DRAFT_2081272 [Lactarius sanguifluus]|nr:hypothetical protein EDB89DRAFT_2081272 [Lactarius sanguifluus]
MPEVEKWIQSSHWSAPLVVTVVCLLLINQHPSPVDDCPCFEDIITVASVILLGIITSFWCSKRVPALNTDLFTSVSPGAALDSPAAITPATECVRGPPHTLRVVPSVIDLDSAVAEVVDEDAGVASGRRGRSGGAGPRLDRVQKSMTFEEAGEGGTAEDGEVRRYDVDVLTKVVVYAIATVMIPALFEALERGV